MNRKIQFRYDRMLAYINEIFLESFLQIFNEFRLGVRVFQQDKVLDTNTIADVQILLHVTSFTQQSAGTKIKMIQDWVFLGGH